MTTKIPAELSSTPGIADSSNATAITIDSSEKVGIGTTSPVGTLQIKTQTNGNAAFQDSTSVTGGVKINCFNDAANASVPFEIDGSSLQFNIAATEKMRIDSSGNVGIGTTPASGVRLDIRNNSTVTIADLRNANSSGFGLYVAGGSSSSQYALRAADKDNNALFSVMGNGNVGIGESTVTHRLEVLSTVANYASGRIVNNTGSASTEYGFISQLGNDPNNTTNYLYLGGSSSTTRYIVWSNGNVQNTNNSYGAYSDVKLKENIVDANPQLEKIKQLQVRNFNLKTEPDTKLIGLVAQEAEIIFPKLIDVSEDTENDENGAIVKTGETTKSIKYSVFVPVLIKAIQEQQDIIDDLKSRIETLEG